MTSTVLGVLVALALIAIVATGQYRAWQRWQRRARRNATVEALLASTRDPVAPLLGDRVEAASSAASRVPAAMPANPVDRLALWLRQRNGARKVMSGAVGLLVIVALLIISYPLLTDLYTNKLQSKLRGELASKSLQQDFRNGSVKVGDALTRIKIDTIGVDVVVVEGTTTSALRAGAGHYVQTPLPCKTGNVGIAGHRTTYGKPFHDLNKLQVGDVIVLDTPVGECTYKVNKPPFSVKPSQVNVLDPDAANPSTLTLTTCDPPGSAAKRLVVQATLDPTLTKQTVS
jgi:sortase A